MMIGLRGCAHLVTIFSVASDARNDTPQVASGLKATKGFGELAFEVTSRLHALSKKFLGSRLSARLSYRFLEQRGVSSDV